MGTVAKVTKEQWVDEGFARFGREGRAGLAVEPIARALRCSKSSFYWYFGSQRDFELAVIERWRLLQTQAIMEAAEQRSTPREKLQRVVESVLGMQKSGDFLFHLRHVARTDEKVRAQLAAIEGTRVGYVAKLLEQLGQSRALARENADVLYDYYLGWYERRKLAPITAAEVKRQMKIVARLIQVPFLAKEASS